jgi:hypothetical protein
VWLWHSMYCGINNRVCKFRDGYYQLWDLKSSQQCWRRFRSAWDMTPCQMITLKQSTWHHITEDSNFEGQEIWVWSTCLGVDWLVFTVFCLLNETSYSSVVG